ncbi:hypothetical protein [Desulfoferrobacter suflitae]|uniref:hypothetical protein n=1 Tax=Desulfoferrobacter suflitae TaxID=2865782 RepID=UPI0021643FA9|nr:hypothetical protein [Desulfoferrobacter suflitae]MCK8603594.1 hypothetical protein [Desulfoferrobacter suflitae]
MKHPIISPLWIWAARDLMRHPYEALLLVLSLTSLIAIMGAALLLVEAVSHEATDLLKAGPSLVVRRISGGGWVPLPKRESLQLAKSVPGVVHARTRLWGTVLGPEGPVTLFGVDQLEGDLLLAHQLSRRPAAGEAVIGHGVLSQLNQTVITLTGQETLNFKIIQILEPHTSVATHDIVLLDATDAGKLLGVPDGFASDLAIEVFHEEEEQAIVPDLAAAFPWPVRITTRREAIGSYSAGWARLGGMTGFILLPALTALALIVAGTIRDRLGRRYEVGLLKALGWTSTDLIRLQMYRAILLAMAAAACGMLSACLLVFWPGSPWAGFFLSGWQTHPAALHINASGAFWVLVQISAIIILPFLTATLWPALKGVAADPQDLLQGHER